MEKLRIGVSACLIGQKVRFNGGHKQGDFVAVRLGEYASWVPVCPELEIGLGVPRPTLRLEGTESDQRLIMPSTGEDYTDQMNAFSKAKLEFLATLDLDGYVLKAKSPSCGMERVKLYPDNKKGHAPSSLGVGTFAAALLARFPLMPIEEEGRLNDSRLRENFISRLFAYQRWKKLCASNVTRRKLTQFHARHKYQLMAHNQSATRALGKLLASPDDFNSDQELAASYFESFSHIMQRPPTIRNHVNALQHMSGYFTRKLDADDRQEMVETIESYRLGLLPFIVPITLIRHYVRKFDLTYLQDQVYLYPHPNELKLLNGL